jgi:predicted RNA-binding protein YlqC (UPF0109 family)
MATIEQQFIEYTVKSLVEYPDDVVVDHIVDDKGILLTLTVNPEDLGRVIGRRGATAQSLRTLLRALGTKNNERYNLKIVNNDEPSDDSASSTTDDTTTDDADDVQSVDSSSDESVENETEQESDYAKKSRQELAELDDLDI